MTVQKFRSVADMPRPEPAEGGALLSRIRILWNRARLLSPPPIVPRGVTRFRSLDEANAARELTTLERMRASSTQR